MTRVVSPSPLPSPVSSNVAALSTKAYLQIMTEAEFQAANFKLRSREYKYYYEANKDRLDAIPELSDMSGGLSNPALFNFVYYCVWKSAYMRLPTEELQQRFSERFGDALLDNIAPDARRAMAADQCSQSAARCAAIYHLQPAHLQAMLAVLRHVLSHDIWGFFLWERSWCAWMRRALLRCIPDITLPAQARKIGPPVSSSKLSRSYRH